MKISARNRLKGKIVEVKKGATTAHVRIDIGGGSIVTASITNEAVDELGLALRRRRLCGRQSLGRHDRRRLIVRPSCKNAPRRRRPGNLQSAAALSA